MKLLQRLVLGVPLLVIAMVGVVAIAFNWDWLDRHARRWFLELRDAFE